MVGNLIHPTTPTDDPAGVARVIASSGLWVADHLGIVIGLILMMGGLVALARAIASEGGPAATWAYLAGAATIAGVTVGLILVTLDGLAAKHLADAWSEAPAAQRPIALRLVSAEETFNFALAALFNVLFAGVTYLLFGLAVMRSRAYAGGLGWIAVAAGLGSIVAGLLQAVVGESTSITRTLTIVFPTVITLWSAALGVMMVRRSREVAR
jgi:hypothetical protein